MQRDDPRESGAVVRIVGKNVAPYRALPADARIELAFDRYLLSASITRQTFQTSFPQSPNIAYDPVARIVTIAPLSPLTAGQTYTMRIASPAGPEDPDGLRAIDGATIDPVDAVIEFPVVASAGPPVSAPTVDFCRDILPIFASKCSAGPCHGPAQGAAGLTAAAGLSLDSAQSVAASAIGRVAHETNTGPRAMPQAPRTAFGVDMPIIDPGGSRPGGGNPGNSWLLYKLLLAVPPPRSSTSVACDGEPPTAGSAIHILTPPAISDPGQDPARRALANYVLGREMPFPSNSAQPLGETPEPLTIEELERLSQWIAQDRRPNAPDGGTVDRPLVPTTCCGR